MPRLLSSPAVRAQGRSLVAGAAPLATDIRELLERERAAAYAEGRAAGLAEAAAAEMDAAGAAATALRAAIEQDIARLHDARATYDANVLQVATEIATYVVDAVDTTAVDEIARRIRAALEQIDDSEIVAHVQPDQVEAVGRAVADCDVRVVGSRDIAAGDVRLVGRWSVADLSIRQRWAAVEELLDAAT